MLLKNALIISVALKNSRGERTKRFWIRTALIDSGTASPAVIHLSVTANRRICKNLTVT